LCYSFDIDLDTGVENDNEKTFGWCGVCDVNAKLNTSGYCGPGAGVIKRGEYHNLINYRHVTPSEGWGYCTKDCSGGSGHAQHLQIVDQSVLPHEDCTKL